MCINMYLPICLTIVYSAAVVHAMVTGDASSYVREQARYHGQCVVEIYNSQNQRADILHSQIWMRETLPDYTLHPLSRYAVLVDGDCNARAEYGIAPPGNTFRGCTAYEYRTNGGSCPWPRHVHRAQPEPEPEESTSGWFFSWGERNKKPALTGGRQTEAYIDRKTGRVYRYVV